MKKIIGVLGVVVIAMAMFSNTNTMNGLNSDFDLASLLIMNTANAECMTYDENGNQGLSCDDSDLNCTLIIEFEGGGTYTITCPNSEVGVYGN